MAEDTKAPQPSVERDTGGRFKPGNRGGPGGSRRPPDAIIEMWKDATPHATKRHIEALDAERPVVVSGGKDAPSHIEMVPDHDMRLKAIELLYSRQWGKPAQSHTDEEGEILRMGLVILPAREEK